MALAVKNQPANVVNQILLDTLMVKMFDDG